MIVVVPPYAAARVPVSNVSLAAVPPNGSSMWVCASIPPGITYLPPASITSSTAIVGLNAGSRTATIFSPSTSTSATRVPVGPTTVPPLTSKDMARSPLRFRQISVRVGAAVAVELPAVADGLQQAQVQVADDQFRIV